MRTNLNFGAWGEKTGPSRRTKPLVEVTLREPLDDPDTISYTKPEEAKKVYKLRCDSSWTAEDAKKTKSGYHLEQTRREIRVSQRFSRRMSYR